MARRFTLRRKVLFSLVPLGVSLLLAEGAIRLWESRDQAPADPALAATIAGRRKELGDHYARIHRAGPIYTREAIPGSTSTLCGIEYRINRWGMRDRDVPVDPPPGVRRIAVLGDSVAAGLGVAIEDTLGRRLEAGLGPPWQVLNFAVDGHTLADEYTIARERAVLFGPEALVFVLCPNDLGDPFRAGERGLTARRAKERLLSYSRLLSRVDEFLYRRRDDNLHALGMRPCWGVVESNLGLVAEEFAARALPVLVVFVPYGNQLDRPELDPHCQGRLASMCEALDVPFLDATSALRAHGSPGLYPAPEESFLYPRDHVHPTPAGHRVLAEAIRTALVERGLVR